MYNSKIFLTGGNVEGNRIEFGPPQPGESVPLGPVLVPAGIYDIYSAETLRKMCDGGTFEVIPPPFSKAALVNGSDDYLGRFENGCLDFGGEESVLMTLSTGVNITSQHRYNPGSSISCGIYAVQDSIAGIFDGIRLAVLDCTVGGFRCLDFTGVRANGEPVLDTGGIASGPVSFVQVWDSGVANANAIIKGIAILKSDHKDIDEWKEYKPENLLIGWYE